MSNAVGLLDQTLAEEKKTDATLTEIAESVVNQEVEADLTVDVNVHLDFLATLLTALVLLAALL